MIKYCIGVDMLNFPVFCTHAIKKDDIIYLKSKQSESKDILKSIRHFNMKNK